MIKFESALAKAAIKRFTGPAEQEQLAESVDSIGEGKVSPDTLEDFYSYLGVAWWGVSLAVFLVSFLSYVATDLLSHGSASTIVGRYSFSIFCGVVLFQIVISIRRQASPVMRGKRATRGLLRAATLPSWADLVIIGALCVMGYFLNPFASG
jgi:hypothetical protein